MNTNRRPISSVAAVAALALAASSATAQTLVYNFAQLYDTSNNPDPAGTYPDDFQENGGNTTISQSTVGVPAGQYSMQFQQTSAASFTGALTTVIPEIINDPATTAISFDVTIPSTGNFSGNYANIGISEFGTNSVQLGSTNAIQVQTVSSSEVSLNLAPGAMRLRFRSLRCTTRSRAILTCLSPTASEAIKIASWSQPDSNSTSTSLPIPP